MKNPLLYLVLASMLGVLPVGCASEMGDISASQEGLRDTATRSGDGGLAYDPGDEPSVLYKEEEEEEEEEIHVKPN